MVAVVVVSAAAAVVVVVVNLNIICRPIGYSNSNIIFFVVAFVDYCRQNMRPVKT